MTFKLLIATSLLISVQGGAAVDGTCNDIGRQMSENAMESLHVEHQIETGNNS